MEVPMGKSSINGGCSINGGVSIAMFDYRRGYLQMAI